MRALPAAVILGACVLLLAGARSTWARSVRRLFEPTDLELEDLGIARQVELDVDGALAIEDRAGETFAFDHLSPDDLWLSAKVGLADVRLDWGHGDADPVIACGF